MGETTVQSNNKSFQQDGFAHGARIATSARISGRELELADAGIRAPITSEE